MGDEAPAETKCSSDRWELAKVLFWLGLMMAAGASLLIMAAMAVHTGRIKNRAGPESYDLYAEEPIGFTIQVILMVAFGTAAFFGPLYLMMDGKRRRGAQPPE